MKMKRGDGGSVPSTESVLSNGKLLASASICHSDSKFSAICTTPPQGTSLYSSQYPPPYLFLVRSFAPHSATTYSLGGFSNWNVHQACVDSNIA